MQYRVTDSVGLISKFGESWFDNNIKSQYASIVREVVKKNSMKQMMSDPAAATLADDQITDAIQKLVVAEKIPVEILNVTLGRASPNANVLNQMNNTAAEQQRKLTNDAAKLAEDSRKASEESRATAPRWATASPSTTRCSLPTSTPKRARPPRRVSSPRPVPTSSSSNTLPLQKAPLRRGFFVVDNACVIYYNSHMQTQKDWSRYIIAFHESVNGKTYAKTGLMLGIGAERIRQMVARIQRVLYYPRYGNHIDFEKYGYKLADMRKHTRFWNSIIDTVLVPNLTSYSDYTELYKSFIARPRA